MLTYPDPIPATHILASVMSAPAALAIAKLMCPDEKGTISISSKDAYKVDIWYFVENPFFGTSTNKSILLQKNTTVCVSVYGNNSNLSVT